MKKLRRVNEAEVMAEFLKNEFYEGEFHNHREQFERVVMDPDLNNEAENALRRALLFRRRGHMWRELPADTAWWEVEAPDVACMRVFPRANWRKISNGSYLLADIVERIRSWQSAGKSREFTSKIQSLSYSLRNQQDRSTVILVGIDEQQPVTIIEGNHRLSAALLVSPELLSSRFRYFCGFSPRMDEFCWHHSNLSNVWHYVKNRLKHLFHDADKEVARASIRRVASTRRDGYAEVGTQEAVHESK